MLRRSSSGSLTIWFEDAAIGAQPGDSIAVALLAAGIVATRTTPVSGARRGPFCMMGACFECLVVADGKASVQSCMTTIRDGMRIQRQDGAKTIAC